MLSFVVMDRTTPTRSPRSSSSSDCRNSHVLGLVLSIPFILVGSGSFLGVGEPEVCVSAPIGALDLNSGGQMHVTPVSTTVSPIRATARRAVRPLSVDDPARLVRGRSLPRVLLRPRFPRLRLDADPDRATTWAVLPTRRPRRWTSGSLRPGRGRGGEPASDLGGVAPLPDDDRRRRSSGLWFPFFHLSWTTLFAGFGLLTIGRVMAQSVRMQREIDATV